MTATSITLPVEPKRDRYGRYVIPHPDTGKEMSWTRATTLADTLDDRFNLERWKVRTCALGLVARPDLFALVAAQHDNREELNKICDKALEAGKASEGANMGTALHKACERIDLGDTGFTMPGAAQFDIDAYRKLRATTGATPHRLPDGRPGVEVIIICPELKVAGTFDRLLDLPGEALPCIDDIKTGASAIEWAMTSIAIQLAIYAHGTHIFDPATGRLTPMPRVNQDKAFVTHLPAGKASASMWEVDIAQGWEAAHHAMWVREWRTKKDKLARHAQAVTAAAPPTQPADPFEGLPGNDAPAPMNTSGDPFADFLAPVATAVDPALEAGPANGAGAHIAPASAAPDPFAEFLTPTPAAVVVVDPRVARRDNLAQRAARLKSIDGAAERMVLLWPRDGDTLMPGLTNPHYDHTDTELDKIEAALVEAEKQFEAPFDPLPSSPPERPAPSERPPAPPVIDEGPLLDATDIAALKARIDGLAATQRAWVGDIVKLCGEARLSLNMRDVPSTRRFGIVRALLCCALANFDTSVLELAARTVTGDDTSPLGELVGSMSTDVAATLVDLACAIEGRAIKVVTADEKGTRPTVSTLVLVGDLSPYKPTTHTQE